MSSESVKFPFFSPRRVLIIAGNTFTQLIRMKVFYFLLVFVLLGIGIHFLPELPHLSGPESVGPEELRRMKSMLIAVMKLFALILGIVATSLIIPRDVEDRTLYTILSKPVPRLDYLVGKLLGILLLIFAGLALMALLLDLVLHFRTQAVLAEWMQAADTLIAQGQWTAADKESARLEILHHGVTWSLQAAMLTIFFEAAVIAALALLVSTFSSSTLFTVVIATLCYFIGQFIANGRDYWLAQSRHGEEPALVISSKILVVIFPDFRPYGIADKVIAGANFPPDVLGSLALTTGLYVGIYLVLSWFVFSDKEI